MKRVAGRETNAVLGNGGFGVVADVAGDGEADDEEQPYDDVVILAALHALVADPGLFISEVRLVIWHQVKWWL